MSYYDLRNRIKPLLGRSFIGNRLIERKRDQSAVQEKGRKTKYMEYKLGQEKPVPQERLLNAEEVSSFVEISCRAAACPMPLNIDVWDGLLCPFGCKYCYANAFRSSLYTAFFDNSKTMGFRHCNPKMYKERLDELMKGRGRNPHDIKGDVAKAIAMDVPMRFGIRFEDFLAEEAKQGIALELLQYLGAQQYPLMINSKSALLKEDRYVRALAENCAGTAVHITLISSNNDLLQALEPGAPTYEERLETMRTLCAAGVRTVARIEPFLPFVNDHEEEVQKYIHDVWEAGVRNITFDTYSYTAKNQGIRQSFINEGLDWDQIVELGCESQGFGSLLLGEFMKLFREAGFSCSTFDMGNVPDNDQAVCCEVGDWFKGGFNWGCTVMAARYILRRGRKGRNTSWSDFVGWVDNKGGFLSESLKAEVHRLWNCQGNAAYASYWSRGLRPVGYDESGLVWNVEKEDWRKELLTCLR